MMILCCYINGRVFYHERYPCQPPSLGAFYTPIIHLYRLNYIRTMSENSNEAGSSAERGGLQDPSKRALFVGVGATVLAATVPDVNFSNGDLEIGYPAAEAQGVRPSEAIRAQTELLIRRLYDQLLKESKSSAPDEYMRKAVDAYRALPTPRNKGERSYIFLKEILKASNSADYNGLTEFQTAVKVVITTFKHETDKRVWLRFEVKNARGENLCSVSVPRKKAEDLPDLPDLK